MAWTFVLVGSGTSLDLNDGTFYQVNVNGFQAPAPERLTSYSGNTFFRHGADLIKRSYGNRIVTIDLSIAATNASTLGQKVRDVWDFLRRAEEFAKDNVGTQIQLRYQWEGATGTYLFNILEGNLDLGRDLHGPYLLRGTRVQHAVLELVCQPFAVQLGETVQNFAKDPSFEMAATELSDWTLNALAGTVARTTSTAKYGTASLLVSRSSASGTSATGVNANQSIVLATTLTSGTSMVLSGWAKRPTPTADPRLLLYLQFYNANGTSLAITTAYYTGTSTGFVQWSVTQTATGTVGTVLILTGIPGETAAGSGTSYIDGLYFNLGSTVPTAWVSGRDIANHFDDDGQAHINYLDVYDIPGDVPALMQIKILETATSTGIWVGARHDTRQTGTGMFIEGEAFTSTIGAGWTSSGDAPSSHGSIGHYAAVAQLYPSMTATTPAAPQVIMYNIASPPQGQFRVLARIGEDSQAASIRHGLGYQYGGVTKDPSVAAQYVEFTGVTDTHELLDLGVITIPPVRTPAGGTVGTFGLRLAHYINTTTAATPEVDYVMLMPVDQGGVFAKKTSAVDNLWVDSRSNPQGAYRVTTADIVQSFPPDQVGNPPLGHPKGSRFYFLWDGTLAAGATAGTRATVSLTYIPQYLHVGT